MNTQLVDELLLTSDSSLDERKLQITIWVKMLSTVIFLSRLIHATHEQGFGEFMKNFWNSSHTDTIDVFHNAVCH